MKEELDIQLDAARRFSETLDDLHISYRATVTIEEVKPRGENKWGHDEAELISDGKNRLVLEQTFRVVRETPQ